MRDSLHSVYLALLRAALWENDSKLENFPALNAAQWLELFGFVRAQAQQALICPVVSGLPEDLKPSAELLSAMQAEDSTLRKWAGKTSAVADAMARSWEKEGLDAVLLKGQTVATFYPDPATRPSGDVDWYFASKADFEAANAKAERICGQLNIDSDGDADYLWQGVRIEHHRRWHHLQSRRARLLLAEISSEAATRDALVLCTHLLKHAMVKGAGYRQLCDLAMCYRHYQGLLDGYCDMLERLNLMRWARCVNSLLISELGFPKELLPCQAGECRRAERLARMLREEGDCGNSAGRVGLGGQIAKMALFMRLAPREYFARIFQLVCGRVARIFKNN